jgi:hypothetical protein
VHKSDDFKLMSQGPSFRTLPRPPSLIEVGDGAGWSLDILMRLFTLNYWVSVCEPRHSSQISADPTPTAEFCYKIL